jgi:hypothetical protein
MRVRNAPPLDSAFSGFLNVGMRTTTLPSPSLADNRHAMAEILVTCTDCGQTLKVSGSSPEGRFVRCPSCTTIFIAAALSRTPSAQNPGPKLVCTDCAAIQYAVQPIAGGKFVRCLECGSVFRVPGQAPSAATGTERSRTAPRATPEASGERKGSPVNPRRASPGVPAETMSRSRGSSNDRVAPDEDNQDVSVRVRGPDAASEHKPGARMWVPIAVFCGFVAVAALIVLVAFLLRR